MLLWKLAAARNKYGIVTIFHAKSRATDSVAKVRASFRWVQRHGLNPRPRKDRFIDTSKRHWYRKLFSFTFPCYCRLRVALFHVHETLDYLICVRVTSALNLKSALSFCHYAYSINFADLILQQQQNTENNARPALPETANYCFQCSLVFLWMDSRFDEVCIFFLGRGEWLWNLLTTDGYFFFTLRSRV